MRFAWSRLGFVAQIAVLAASAATLGACGSGGSQGPTPVPVDVSVSDAAVGDLAAVVVTLERVTFDRPGEDVVVETFPNPDPGQPDTETITFDLLDYPVGAYAIYARHC